MPYVILGMIEPTAYLSETGREHYPEPIEQTEYLFRPIETPPEITEEFIAKIVSALSVRSTSSLPVLHPEAAEKFLRKWIGYRCVLIPTEEGSRGWELFKKPDAPWGTYRLISEKNRLAQEEEQKSVVDGEEGPKDCPDHDPGRGSEK